MTWPKKHTRTITVRGEKFLWHLSKNNIASQETVITVGMDGQKYMLFIDPYPWDFAITPSNISKAVTWALDQGWTPEVGPSKNMAFSTTKKSFAWLPKGTHFMHEISV